MTSSSSTTAQRPFNGEAERRLLYDALKIVFNTLENMTYRVDDEADPSDETAEVTREHIVEVSIALEDLDIHLAEFRRMRDTLERQRSYLVAAYVEQEIKRADSDDA